MQNAHKYAQTHRTDSDFILTLSLRLTPILSSLRLKSIHSSIFVNTSLKWSETPMYKGFPVSEVLVVHLTQTSLRPHSDLTNRLLRGLGVRSRSEVSE